MASENYCATPRQVIDSKWWPETGPNRRRRPFQGCRTIQLSGPESADVLEGKGVMFR
jgi:hypothetical protein